MVTTVAHTVTAPQIEDDLALLRGMVADMKAAPPIYQPTHYWAAYEPLVLAALSAGLRDFRRTEGILSAFGATDVAPSMLAQIDGVPPEAEATVTNLVSALNRSLELGEPRLPFGLSITDVFELAYQYCRNQSPHAPAIVSIDELEVSRVGNPFGFDRDGHFLTMSALYYYLRYTFVAEQLDMRDVDVVVELGSGSGKQAEILKRLHPHLTIVLVDLAPQFYVAERFLHAAFPRRRRLLSTTLDPGPLDIRSGKIHFIGNHRIRDVKSDGRVLFWSAASMGEMEPEVVAHYGEAVSEFAEWLFLCQCFTGKERANEVQAGGVLDPVVWPHYVAAFGEYDPIERRPAHTGLAPLIEGQCVYEDTFWSRRANRTSKLAPLGSGVPS